MSRGPGAIIGALAWIALFAASAGCGDVHVYPFLPAGGDAGSDGSVSTTCAPRAQVGFATVGGVTTGGVLGATVTVDNLNDLIMYAGMSAPLTIQIRGSIVVDTSIATDGQVDVASDKTILGIGKSSGLTGGGFRVKQGHNVIFQNLVISKAVGTDAIQLLTAVHVWIDHCDLSSDRDNGKSYYDGLVDISHASDYVTISWTRFHDHFHCSLVGHSADNGAEDTGFLRVTYHHNLFEQTSSEMPRVRFGTDHVFNNHYRNIDIYAIASQMGAALLVERNVFENVVAPMYTHYDDPIDGTIHAVDNTYSGSGALEPLADTTWIPPYDYASALDLVESVPNVVDTCAGVGKI